MNQLTGTLPSGWSECSQLQALYLNNIEFTGTLPGQWSSMSGLQVLWLNNSRLTGSFPASWNAMPSLAVLDLTNNQLSGPLPMLNSTTLLVIGIKYIQRLHGHCPCAVEQHVTASCLRPRS
jgi:hypothetical protein